MVNNSEKRRVTSAPPAYRKGKRKGLRRPAELIASINDVVIPVPSTKAAVIKAVMKSSKAS